MRSAGKSRIQVQTDNMKLTGRCLCGGVHYACDTPADITALCHCRTCQRQTGTVASFVVGVKDADLHVRGATLGTFVTQGDSGQSVQRSFCTNCGSPIVSRCNAMPGVAFIKAGTLDDCSTLKPTVEFYLQDALPWVPHLNGTKVFTRM